MCGALAMNVNHEALVQAPHTAKPTKAGERSSARLVPAMPARSSRTRCRLVSPSRMTVATRTTPPKAVGNRAVDQLPGGNPGEMEAHDELNMRRRVGE